MVDRTCPGCGDQHGPPRLPGTELHASVSHSGDVVAVAVTDAGPVGIDVEEIGVLDYARLMQDVCAEDERPFVDGAVAFYAYWTRKEAFLKATTEGLTRRMADIVVSPPKLPPAILDVRNGPTPPTRMRDLSVEGYSATAAVLTSGTVRWVVRQDDLRSTVRGRTEGAHDGDGTPQSDYDDERDGAGERADRGRG
jgi:4'-phosphopantetheinyl transferase